MKFFVRDTGIGIPEDMYDYIFERFNKIESDNTKLYGGTGIGLSITKKLVELLGGRIWVESKIGMGSIFYFTLPFNTSGKYLNNVEDEGNTNTKNWKGKNILVAEDNIPSFKYIEELLSDTGVNIIHAKDGLEAVEYCSKNKNIDIILMDIKMPEMDGYKAIKLIKKDKPELPIIAQTAYAMHDDEQKAREAGADDYISKPINEELIIKMINRYFNK